MKLIYEATEQTLDVLRLTVLIKMKIIPIWPFLHFRYIFIYMF